MNSTNNEILPQGYKMTELGPLPEEWEVVRLGEITQMRQGKVLPTELLTKNGFPVFGANGQIGWYRNYTHEESEVLITCRGATCGTINIAPPKSFITNNAMITTPLSENKLTKNFLSFALLTSNLKQVVTGSGQPQITKASLSTIPIPLPPMSEQRKIAAVLSAVQEAKEKTEAVIEATKALKKSMMKHLFTYGPVPPEEIENVPLKETEIGKVPEDWEVVKLGDIGDNRKETVDPKKEDIAYVGLEHINSGDSKLKRYGNSSEIKSSKSRFYKDDILYAKLRPYLDKGILAQFEGICSTDILVIKPNKELVNPQYLTSLLHMPNFLDFATKSMTGVNHPRTSWSVLKTFKLPLPPLPIQQKIASILSAIDAKIEAEENKKVALEELFKTLLNNLMTAKIRVNNLEVK